MLYFQPDTDGRPVALSEAGIWIKDCHPAQSRSAAWVKWPESMAFRIETAARGRCTVFILSGRIEKQAVAELNKLLENQAAREDIVLDLKDVGVVDRDAMCFFARCEADGVQLENCTPYIREWMEREKD
jgi:hypothetical protein